MQNARLQPDCEAELFRYNNENCYICNGFYGPCFEDQICSTCHAFLHPMPPDFGIDFEEDEDADSDDQGEDADSDDQGEDADSDDQGEDADSDDQGEDADTDDQGEDADSDDQGEDADSDDQGEDADSDDQGEDADTDEQGEDADSGNDEPNNAIPLFSIPPVQVEELDLHLNRITEYTEYTYIQNADITNIHNLPTEVLMQVFEHLDDISLWSVGQVSVRLNEMLNMYVRTDRWRNFTLLRWPLFVTMSEDVNWYKVYSAFMESCACTKCVLQMASQDHSIIEEDSWRSNRQHRLRAELREGRLDPLEGIQALPLDSHCRYWQGTIAGPNDSPYEGGLFYLYIQIPQGYPIRAPVVRFLTKIFHPNISRHGDIGMDSIRHNWPGSLAINKVLLSVQSLLTDPYCDICMEPEIGALYLRDRASYDQQVRIWTQRYAMIHLRCH